MYIQIIAWTFALSSAGFTGLSTLPALLHRWPVTEQLASSAGLYKENYCFRNANDLETLPE